jgi:5-methylcytosine-specific restriction protein A
VLGDGYSRDLLERKALYKTPRWRALRKAFLTANPWCSRCAEHDLKTRAVVLDHTKGHGGDWRVRFWSGPFTPLCIPCHQRKRW